MRSSSDTPRPASWVSTHLSRLLAAAHQRMMRTTLVRRMAIRVEAHDHCPELELSPLRLNRRQLRAIIRANRRVLSSVPVWITPELCANSLHDYGVPAALRPLLNAPVGNEPTYSDVLLCLAQELRSPVRYLELGVSVGKNFFQLMQGLEGAILTGVDIEDVPPLLEANLVLSDVTEWLPTRSTLRPRCYHRRYQTTLRGNRISHLTGDVLDPSTWAQLRGQQFNLVFSDACHTPRAIQAEYDALRGLDLLDPTEFIILWDDLGNPQMRQAVWSIVRDVRSRFGLAANVMSIEFYRGWAGIHEYRHTVGVLRHVTRE